jgi:hypothetical protein
MLNFKWLNYEEDKTHRSSTSVTIVLFSRGGLASNKCIRENFKRSKSRPYFWLGYTLLLILLNHLNLEKSWMKYLTNLYSTRQHRK